MRDTERRATNSRRADRRFLFEGLVTLLAMTALVGGAGVACTSTGASDPTPVLKFKITPASGTYAAAPSPPPPVAAVVSPSVTGNAIKLVGQDTKFDQTALAASAGPVTIRFSNKDSGVPHDLHVFAGADAKGKSVGQTDLVSGPVDQELKLELAPGAYYFQCDAHPTTMKGTLTVR
jgi:plastocyanin